MFSPAFLKDLGERTLATFAEALAALLIAGNVGVLEFSWRSALSLAGMTALVSLLKGVAAYRVSGHAGEPFSKVMSARTTGWSPLLLRVAWSRATLTT